MECLKQSTHNTDSWSTRVVTVDRLSGTLTVSRHRHPSDVFYHSLRPTVVQTWPHFSTETMNDDFYSTEAKLTLCILGTVASVPDFAAAEEVALVGIALPRTSEVIAELPDAVYPPPPYTPATAASIAAPSTSVTGRVRREKVGTFDAWVVRFVSKAAYNVALHMLSELPEVTFTRGQHQIGDGARADPMLFSAGRLGPLSLMTPSSSSSSKQSRRHTSVVH